MAACIVTKLRVKVVILAVGCAVAVLRVGASGLEAAQAVTVSGLKHWASRRACSGIHRSPWLGKLESQCLWVHSKAADPGPEWL